MFPRTSPNSIPQLGQNPPVSFRPGTACSYFDPFGPGRCLRDLNQGVAGCPNECHHGARNGWSVQICTVNGFEKLWAFTIGLPPTKVLRHSKAASLVWSCNPICACCWGTYVPMVERWPAGTSDVFCLNRWVLSWNNGNLQQKSEPKKIIRTSTGQGGPNNNLIDTKISTWLANLLAFRGVINPRSCTWRSSSSVDLGWCWDSESSSIKMQLSLVALKFLGSCSHWFPRQITHLLLG